MESSARIGSPVSFKPSTGYCPPELMLLGDRPLPSAQPHLDVWGYGCVLYFCCTGQPLLHVGLNDHLEDEQVRSGGKNASTRRRRHLSTSSGAPSRTCLMGWRPIRLSARVCTPTHSPAGSLACARGTAARFHERTRSRRLFFSLSCLSARRRPNCWAGPAWTPRRCGRSSPPRRSSRTRS